MYNLPGGSVNSNRKKIGVAKKPGVVAHSFNSIIWETEAEGVQGQRELYCETILKPQKMKQKRNIK